MILAGIIQKAEMSELTPIHFPALGNPFKEASAGNHFSYSMKDFIKTDVGESTAIYAVVTNQKFAENISVAGLKS